MSGWLIFLAYALVLVAVAGGVSYAFILYSGSRIVGDRLRKFTGSSPSEIPEALLVRSAEPKRMAATVAKLAVSTDPDDLSVLRVHLVQAGFKGPRALEIYSASKVMLTVVLPLCIWASLPHMPTVFLAMITLIAAAIGYYLPAAVVAHRAEARAKALVRSLPDCLDLLVACVEAGLGLEAALARVAERMEKAAPDLSYELGIVQGEILAGRPRPEALKRMVRRTGVPAINSLVNVLIQAEQLGTPIAQALRVHSGTVRTRRMLSLEEEAAKISPKLTVAMVLFLLPPLFIVILGPAGISIFRELLPTMAG